jgi:hypothetical protein
MHASSKGTSGESGSCTSTSRPSELFESDSGDLNPGLRFAERGHFGYIFLVTKTLLRSFVLFLYTVVLMESERRSCRRWQH